MFLQMPNHADFLLLSMLAYEDLVGSGE